MISKLALALLCAAPVPVFAQAVPPPQQQQRAAQQTGVDPRQFVDAAYQIVRAVEGNQAGPIWDTASPVMKSTTPRDQFIASMQKRTATNGPLASREWVAITRTRVDPSAKVPQGDYLTVNFVGSTRTGLVIRSSVSFHLDSDSSWRLAGYAM
jgi:hypothetical protein